MRCKHRYTVYDNHTDFPVIVSGTVDCEVIGNIHDNSELLKGDD